MSSEEVAGPFRSSERPKKRKIENTSYCGLTDIDVTNILKSLGNDNLHLSSDEEPFIDSGSEYTPDSEEESEQGLSSGEEDDLLEHNETVETPIPDANLDDSDSNHQNVQDFTIIWDTKDFVPVVHQFDQSNSGLKNKNLENVTREVEYFLNLFSEEMANVIVKETNLFAQQQNAKKWKNIDTQEFFVFLALTMLMPHVKKEDLKDYWSTDYLVATLSFGKTMSRDRFLQILRYLHFNNNEVASIGRLCKIERILNMVQANFQNQFNPFANLVIDESMVLFKGRLIFKQYIKTKRHRFGIKLYVLCDCETGYVLNFIVYAGKDANENRNEDHGLGLSGDVVVKLLEPYLNKGHSFYSDNYYTSPSLATYLFEQKTNYCGTVRLNRKQMPVVDKKLKKGETDWRSEHILALKWKDRRDVSMLTTLHENKIITIPKIDRVTKKNKEKPLCVLAYNEQMGAVDRSDMMITTVDCTRKTIKWYKKLFFHTMDICMLNAHALYMTQNANHISFPKFHLEVVRQLLERYPLTYNPKPTRSDAGNARLTERHFPDEVPRKEGKLQLRRCWVCSHTKIGEKKRKDSKYMCTDCNVGLCVSPCFRLYHKEVTY